VEPCLSLGVFDDVAPEPDPTVNWCNDPAKWGDGRCDHPDDTNLDIWFHICGYVMTRSDLNSEICDNLVDDRTPNDPTDNWCNDPAKWGDGRCDVSGDTALTDWYYKCGWYLAHVESDDILKGEDGQIVEGCLVDVPPPSPPEASGLPPLTCALAQAAAAGTPDDWQDFVDHYFGGNGAAATLFLEGSCAAP